MQNDQLLAFFEKVSQDPSLLSSLNAESPDPVAIAKAAGFEITEEELNEFKASELSIYQLEGVSGGGKDQKEAKKDPFPCCCCPCCSCSEQKIGRAHV